MLFECNLIIYHISFVLVPKEKDDVVVVARKGTRHARVTTPVDLANVSWEELRLGRLNVLIWFFWTGLFWLSVRWHLFWPTGRRSRHRSTLVRPTDDRISPFKISYLTVCFCSSKIPYNLPKNVNLIVDQLWWFDMCVLVICWSLQYNYEPFFSHSLFHVCHYTLTIFQSFPHLVMCVKILFFMDIIIIFKKVQKYVYWSKIISNYNIQMRE